MALDTQKRKQVVYFVGDEIENTIAKGFRTLFVVGTRDPKAVSYTHLTLPTMS